MEIEINATPEDMLMFVVCLIIGCLVLILLAVSVIKSKEAENGKKSVNTKKATVLDVQVVSGLEAYIIFETEDGERLRFIMEKQFTYVQGDCGVLTWQGNKIISYKIERKD